MSAEALTEVEAQYVARRAFDRVLQDGPDVRRSVFLLIEDMLPASREQALLLGRKNAMERAASFLLFLEKRFCDPDTGFVSIEMNRSDIADYLGLTLETVSRMLNRLKKAGRIELLHPSIFKVLSSVKLLAAAGEIDQFDKFGRAS